MACKSTSIRDPYSYPTFENDDTFRGRNCAMRGSYAFGQVSDSQHGATWDRLNTTKTLASARREVLFHDPKAPNDDLDYLLKARYNNGVELFADKSHVCLQKETFGADHGRVLKNRVVYVAKPQPALGHPLRVAEQGKKEVLNSVKKAIDGHHTELTNPGFHRKHDGGFYMK